ncbi:phosphate signaling complex protein PhoU [bacterium]|nr:phosphate signaling complex protein PhoU [bacterium]
MTEHFRNEIEKLKRKVLTLSAEVGEAVHKAVTAVSESNVLLGLEVYEGDAKIDELEVEIEEDCLKILALYQPVAIDLRFIVSVLRTTSDLERIGDFAASIGKKAGRLSTYSHTSKVFDFVDMADRAQSMLRRATQALINMDANAAQEVRTSDDTVDAKKRDAYDCILERHRNNPDELVYLLDLLGIARHLERIADHATNIAENVIYMSEGEIVRHKSPDAPVS